MTDRKCYLAVFSLPRAEPEHMRILELIRAASAGDFKQVVVNSGMVFAFTCAKQPHTIDFSRVLLRADEVAFFELGNYYAGQGFGALRGWMNSHGVR